MRTEQGRNSRLLLGCLAAACLVASATASARAAELRWKFKPGLTLHYTMEQTISQRVETEDGRALAVDSTQTIEMTWKVKSVEANGTGVLEQTIDHVITSVKSPFGKYIYDSKDGKMPDTPGAAESLAVWKALVGQPFSYRMSPSGALSEIVVPKSLTSALKDASKDPEGAGGKPAGGAFTEDALKKMIQQSSQELPVGEIEKGKTWTKSSTTPRPPIGSLKFERIYTYDGPAADKPGLDKIALQTKVSVVPDDAADKSLQLEITNQKTAGGFYFDPKEGRMTGSNFDESLEMTTVAQGIKTIMKTRNASLLRLDKVEGAE